MHLHGISLWPIGRFQPCASFGFFQIGHLPFTKITFLDTCQKTVSTPAPQFRNNLFCSEITPTSIQSHSSYPEHTAIQYNWVKPFFAPGLTPSICASPTRRFTFRLFTCPDRSIKITLRLYIGNKPPLATTPLPFSFQQLQKTPGFPVTMAGTKHPDEGPSNAPPAIRHRLA